MIKCVNVDDLKVGMYIHDLNCDWMTHPFLLNHFKISNDHEIQKIKNAGIYEVFIDSSKGLDLPSAPSEIEIRKQLDIKIREIASQSNLISCHIDAKEEIECAKKVHREANGIIHETLQNVKLGKQVQIEQINSQVEKMTDSLLRNSGALLALCRIKNKDNYTFQHSVSVGALMVSFCNGLGMSKEEIKHAGIGGMLHDVGKMRVPDSILNKPEKLTEQEFKIMRCHVVESTKILMATPSISEIAILVAGQHHERHDGSGYPEGLKGSEISKMGQMASIVDVYDALTSNRCYHKGIQPTDALRKIYDWSKFHFEPDLVQSFMKIIGIYPVGALVLLESGRLGVVVEQNEKNLITPKVKVFYNTNTKNWMSPFIVDLSKPIGHGGADSILHHEQPEKWGVDTIKLI